MNRRRHAQIHLPPLDAGYALTLVDILERAIAAIWRAHGQSMVNLRTMREIDQSTPPVVRSDDPGGPIDGDF